MNLKATTKANLQSVSICPEEKFPADSDKEEIDMNEDDEEADEGSEGIDEGFLQVTSAGSINTNSQ